MKKCEPSKICTGCLEELPLNEFYSNKSRPDGKANECKSCAARRRTSRRELQRDYDTRRYDAYRPQILEERRVYHEENQYEIKMYWIQKKYNITPKQYEDMLMRQNYKCAVTGCGTSAFTETLAVDHDHSCCPENGRSCGNCIRGLLCSRCNMTLGMVRDSQAILSGLVGYLGDAE